MTEVNSISELFELIGDTARETYGIQCGTPVCLEIIHTLSDNDLTEVETFAQLCYLMARIVDDSVESVQDELYNAVLDAIC